MCGIAGVVGLAADQMQMSRVLRRQACRGPDDKGIVEIEGLATLGHTRLSILDLSHAGHQPMTDPSGRFTLVFNGEIYNHVELRRRAKSSGWHFKGSSDTEVLLACWALWGANVLNDLNGMFAFCVVDSVDRSASLVRDRFGVKPLFVRRAAERLEFASMPDVLASETGRLSLNTGFLARGLATWGYDSDCADSSFRGIESLPGGTMMRVGLGPNGCVDTSESRWYEFGARVREYDVEFGERGATTRLRGLLRDSIALRMRADVPVGLSLSGGLDSSIIASVATEEASQPIQGFFFCLGPRDKEALAVRDLTSRLGGSRLEVHQVGPPSRERMGEIVEKAILCQGAPVASLSAIAQYRVFGAARAAGVPVMLGGQGADEAFMGYRKYQVAAMRGLLGERRYLTCCRAAVSLSRTLVAEGQDLGGYVQAASRYWVRSKPRGLSEFLPKTKAMDICASPRDLQIDDVKRLGLPTLLRVEDRNSMAHSVESRHPFMDYRVMELGAALGSDTNIRQGYGKWILRKAFESRIPESIAWARFKRGFDAGDRRWLDLGVGLHLRDAIRRNAEAIADALSVARSAVNASAYTDEALERSSVWMSDALALAWIGLTLEQEDSDVCA